MSERIFNNPSSIAGAYDNNVSHEFREGVAYADTASLPLLDNFLGSLPEGARILDIGVGPSASFALNAARRGLDVTLQDGSPQVLESAVDCFATADMPLAGARVGVLPEIPFRNGVFDAAMCIHVLHHFELRDIDSSVKNMARILGASGYLAVVMSTSPDDKLHQEPYEIGSGMLVQRNFHPTQRLREIFTDARLGIVAEKSIMDPEDTKVKPMPVSTFVLQKHD